jgi:hypothetical protein
MPCSRQYFQLQTVLTEVHCENVSRDISLFSIFHSTFSSATVTTQTLSVCRKHQATQVLGTSLSQHTTLMQEKDKVNPTSLGPNSKDNLISSLSNSHWLLA